MPHMLTLPKFTLAGVHTTARVLTPVPLIGTDWGEPVAESVKISVAFSVMAELGANLTLTAHAVCEPEQVLVGIEKSAGAPELSDTPVKVVAPPEELTLTVSVELEPTVTLPNGKLEGLKFNDVVAPIWKPHTFIVSYTPASEIRFQWSSVVLAVRKV